MPALPLVRRDLSLAVFVQQSLQALALDVAVVSEPQILLALEGARRHGRHVARHPEVVSQVRLHLIAGLVLLLPL